MTELLREIDVLALDCQASGATPAHGDLLEIGWAVCAGSGGVGPVQSRFIRPRTNRPVPRAIRELTGWTDSRIAEAIDDRAAWVELMDQVKELLREGPLAQAPTVIHFARFELGFLRELHARIEAVSAFPFDAVCLHAIAVRLFPDLPRRNIRALAGYLGHSPELLRRSAGHVEATAFIWRALVPLLEQRGVGSWAELRAWLERTPPARRPDRRVYPLAHERRRELPSGPGVYRFLRKNGDVLYVGKAASLKKRVASHFRSGGPTHERGLELLTQVHDVAHTETASVLEAALLETDEIKRLEPPYNVQLKSGDGCAWFASPDFRSAVSTPDAAHPTGPLPSRGALSALWALIALAEGAEATPALAARALNVPMVFLPDEQLFAEGWRGFAADHLAGGEGTAARRIQHASRALWLERGRTEPESGAEDVPPDAWDLDRLRRRLERNLVQSGLLVRRARWLCLLADASVAFRERGATQARGLVVSLGVIAQACPLESVLAIGSLPRRRPRALHARRGCFDRARYDRMRVLATELRRVHDDGGEIVIRIGVHTLAAERLAALLRAV